VTRVFLFKRPCILSPARERYSDKCKESPADNRFCFIPVNAIASFGYRQDILRGGRHAPGRFSEIISKIPGIQ